MSGPPMPISISTKQSRIANLARQVRGTGLRTLAHHMDLDWLAEAYRQTRKTGATGVDGQSGAEYAKDLEGNLRSLLDRAKTGTYRAPPVRRIHIPKGDGKTRPLGIPTFEDKVLQRAVVMLLEPIYEQEFYDFSYGFRPRQSAHDALTALDQALFRMDGAWVLDVDVQGFFDNLSHERSRELLRLRVVDGVLTRLIGKWLRAGVLDGGVLHHADKGTPQGGVISPLLANVYLHEALDAWWIKDVLPRLRGKAHLLRYADDFAMVFQRKEDAERVFAVLEKRFARFGLTLHPDKTRLVRFQPPTKDAGRPESFDFLGFTHYLARSRSGRWTPHRKTSRKRVSRSLRALNVWLRTARHFPIADQARQLGAKLQGHINYYGLRGNSRAVSRFHDAAQRLWWKWLGRRSQKSRLTWETFNRLLAHYPLPPPRLPPRVWWKQQLLRFDQ